MKSGLGSKNVDIRTTTTAGSGDIGRGQAIAAPAVASVKGLKDSRS
ncbi:MAG: hypothetical protein HY920_02380 [Elusimicrobia bacterium]|nr:hypothetical protein [Elusimicrobiota bacterium]